MRCTSSTNWFCVGCAFLTAAVHKATTSCSTLRAIGCRRVLLLSIAIVSCRRLDQIQSQLPGSLPMMNGCVVNVQTRKCDLRLTAGLIDCFTRFTRLSARRALIDKVISSPTLRLCRKFKSVSARRAGVVIRHVCREVVVV